MFWVNPSSNHKSLHLARKSKLSHATLKHTMKGAKQDTPTCDRHTALEMVPSPPVQVFSLDLHLNVGKIREYAYQQIFISTGFMEVKIQEALFIQRETAVQQLQ